MPSTVVSSFHYNKSLQAIEVVFKSGSKYRYLNVPENIYNDMKNAFSKGTYLNTHIKDKYKFEKLS